MEIIPTCSLHKNEGCLVYVDGASSGNPGPAAVGSVIKAHLNGKLSMMWRAGKSIGKRTINEAEFEALLFGLEKALESQYTHVVAMSDSSKLVKQFHGQHEVGSSELTSLLQQAKEASRKFCGFTLRHIPSTDNMDADAVAHQTLEEAMPPGQLEEDRSCPVCLELFEPPIFQCIEGHLICKGCLESILENANNETYPVCRTPYSGLKIRNRIADDVFKYWQSQEMTEAPLATYKLPISNLDIRAEPLLSSEKVGTLEICSYVDIVEIKMVSQESGKDIWGRISSNKWFKIQEDLPQQPPQVYAVQIPLGTYKIKSSVMPLRSDIRRNSASSGELQPGVHIDIVETVSEDFGVMARTRGGKWVTLLEFTGVEHASSVPLGEYKIEKEAELNGGFRKDSNHNPYDIVNSGEYVTVIETRVVLEDKCVRAKLSNGLWISLVDTEDGSVWARPRDKVDEEEEKRKRDLERLLTLERWTCEVCNKVFSDNHHMHQHYMDLHSFYCKGNVHQLIFFVFPSNNFVINPCPRRLTILLMEISLSEIM